MTTSSDPVTMFVVRREGQWFSAPVPVADPVPVSVGDVRAAVAGCVASPVVLRSGPAATGRPVRELRPSDVVAPVWAWVGVVTPWGVVLEDRDGAHVVLDDVDLTVLDALVGPTPVGELDCDVAQAVVAERLGALVAAGRARLVEPDPTDGPDDNNRDSEPYTAIELAPGVGARLMATVRGSRVADMARASSKVTAVRRWLGLLPGSDSEVVEAPVPVPGPDPAAEPVAMPVGRWGGDDGPEGRIPVYAIWHPDVGPLLSLGMLTASARQWQSGALGDRYEVRRPETAESFLDDLTTRGDGPAVLLCSDYVWSLNKNLDAARAGLEINPDLIVIHGGPSCPKYDADAETFLDTHGGVAHVLARGEGEHLLCELLDTLTPTTTTGLAHPDGPTIDHSALGRITGITYRDASGDTMRTPERDRITNLNELPSPYLTGEFDHIDPQAWSTFWSFAAVETNRGCPYGCTFCDWGSATLSRIRKFDLDRVSGEVRWAAERGIDAVHVTDANFGIMSRDVEIARILAQIKQDTGRPRFVSWTPAKNTTKHLAQIMDVLLEARIFVNASISLQTTDPATLEAVNRSNISTDHYVTLAAEFRRRGQPLQSDLLLGLPGQTYTSYKNDLQFMLDHEIQARTWPVQILPNAPMNDPDYRAQHAIDADDNHLVMATSTFTRADRDRMLQLRKIDIIAERFGVLRHILRYLQWDHHIPATDVMDHLLDLCEQTPNRFPLITWLFDYFDIHPTVPVGWTTFYDEIQTLIHDDYGVDTPPLNTVIALQTFLMPQPGREVPATISLTHDYITYYRTATERLYTTGYADTPDTPLRTHPPTTFTIHDDPLDLNTNGLTFEGNSRDQTMSGEFAVGAYSAYEFQSALTRALTAAVGAGMEIPRRGQTAPREGQF